MSEEIIEPQLENVTPQLEEAPKEEVNQEERVEESQETKSNDYQENIKNLRDSRKHEQERADRAEHERDQMLQYLERMNQASIGNQEPKDNIAEELGVGKDDFVEGEQLAKVARSVKQNRQDMYEMAARNEEMTAELKLKSEYSDFDEIVTSENVKEFIKQNPELKSSIQNNDPIYSRGKATYRLIKKFMKKESQPNYEKKNDKAQDNSSKPRPTSSVNPQQGGSPLTKVNLWTNGYTDEVGEHLRKEMDEAIAKY